jgi:hypothetical protein
MPLTNVPLPGQTLGQTRDLISGNFTSIGTSFVVDHIDYGITNTGQHNKITFPICTQTPIAGTTDSIYLFNQNAAPTNIPDVWIQRGTGTPYPMTGAGKSSNGWSYLPSGILMKWGTAVVNNGNAFTVTFPTGAGIPVFAAIYNVQISVILFNVFATVNTITTTNFTVGNSAGTAGNFSVYYTAIGI